MSSEDSALSRTRKEFAQQAAAMSRSAAFHDDRAVEPFVRLLGEPRVGGVLDLACGPGIVSAALARAGWRVTGLDATRAMLATARQRFRDEGLAPAEWHEGAAESMPFANASIPAAVTRLSLHHFSSPNRVLDELRRVLAPGAPFVAGDIVASADPEEAALHDAFETLRDPSHNRLLPESELLAGLRGSGFEVTAIESWANPKDFDAWAAIVAGAREIESLRVLLRELAGAGCDAGCQLRFEDGSVRFNHHWRFVQARAI